MSRLSKRSLLRVVENAIHASGWNYIHLTSSGFHPASYQIYRHGQSHRVRVYIWNLTPGGRNRPEDEWRIQMTGVKSLKPEIEGKTVVLGWQKESGVFAGFDFERHQSGFGASPSVQLREAAIHEAALKRFATHNKGNGELAIAFLPELFASYVENLEPLHQCGKIAREVDVLNEIGQGTGGVIDQAIEFQVDESRRYAVLAVKRALRKLDFRARVLTAYSNTCAMCGVQLQLLDGAHILPAAHPDSTDETHNGIALCALHHRAFDRALVTFDVSFRIHLNQARIKTLEETLQAAGLTRFKAALRPILSVPPDKRDWPAERFVKRANTLRGWDL